MSKKYSVIFVCLGNICRSPAGENIFRHLVTEAGLESDIFIDSAGTHDYHPGKKPDHRMCHTLESRGIPTAGSGRQFVYDDFEKFDLILAMDTENFSNIKNLDTKNEYLKKIKQFTDYCSDTKNQVPDVPDPYYGGPEGFELVADMLEDGCAEILKNIIRTIKK